MAPLQSQATSPSIVLAGVAGLHEPYPVGCVKLLSCVASLSSCMKAFLEGFPSIYLQVLEYWSTLAEVGGHLPLPSGIVSALLDEDTTGSLCKPSFQC